MRLVQELSLMIELFEALALPNPWLRTEWENILPRRYRTPKLAYLSKLRRDSVGADFQSVRKLTNYIYAKPLELRLRQYSNVSYAFQRYPRYGGYGYLNNLILIFYITS